MTAQDKAKAAWAALNSRQQHYLAAVYAADQNAEARIAQLKRDWVKPPPASQWRWLLYSVKNRGRGHTTIQDQLRSLKQLDPGAGSSLALLGRRGLIQVRDNYISTGLGMVPSVEVRLTAPGRAAARAGLDELAKVRVPAGLLSEWLFGALARLYAAGGKGLLYGAGYPRSVPREERAPSWNSLLQLRDRRDGAFMEEFRAPTEPGSLTKSVYGPYENRVRITPLGREHYERHWRCYRELHPDVFAVDAWATPPDAHAGLAAHRVRRPAGLVDGPGWRLLARLTVLERTDRCYLRDVWAEDYTRDGQPVPGDIAAIPCGLLPWQVQRTSRSTAVTDRLAGRGYVNVVDIPNRRWRRFDPESPPVLHLLCLTVAGRAHVAEHADDYRRLYPDMNIDLFEHH